MFSQHLECAHFIRQMFANSNETVEKILLATDPNLLRLLRRQNFVDVKLSCGLSGNVGDSPNIDIRQAKMNED